MDNGWGTVVSVPIGQRESHLHPKGKVRLLSFPTEVVLNQLTTTATIGGNQEMFRIINQLTGGNLGTLLRGNTLVEHISHFILRHTRYAGAPLAPRLPFRVHKLNQSDMPSSMACYQKGLKSFLWNVYFMITRERGRGHSSPLI